jgi:hypothetical protein
MFLNGACCRRDASRNAVLESRCGTNVGACDFAMDSFAKTS